MTTALSDAVASELHGHLSDVCEQIGVDPVGASLVKYTMNAVFVAPPFVIRLASGPHAATLARRVVSVATCLEQVGAGGRIVLVDCLTLWVSNLMMAGADIPQASAGLVRHLERKRGHFIFVSNEVGLGIVPENRMAREFRDHAGRLHQQIAAVAEELYLVAAGIPLRMKG